MSKFHELANQGQAIWLDFIRRSLLTSGELQSLVEMGLRGMTSNPTIFDKAIVGSNDYDRELICLATDGRSVNEIYETLALRDIAMAADILRPVYDRTDGADGFVSLEVDPKLARDTAMTISEAKRLFAALDRPNVMIKVPSTPEGIPAVTALIAEGININVTLMFSLRHYEAVANAYISGLERRLSNGGDVKHIASVASFFVSRVDTAVDKLLTERGHADLLGKIAVANARAAYALFKETFAGQRWEALASKGARVQRPLWASTGTKNPIYLDTLYLDTLIGPDTVNTVPPKTLDAFVDHGIVAPTLEQNIDGAKAQLAQLATYGIDLDEVTETLQKDGVDAFAQSFESLMSGIEEKCERVTSSWPQVSIASTRYNSAIENRKKQFAENRVSQRIWDRDHTVWKNNPNEISNRLGWLDAVDQATMVISELETFVQGVRNSGYTQALLLGMGGSSLAPEVLRRTYGVKPGYLDLAVLDSTDPGAVLSVAERIDPAKTLFIVSTKSGGTVETLSFFKYFYNRTAEAVGSDTASDHFVAVTDPGSSLEELAHSLGFRRTFLNDPNIGGRYSALSYFGLVPAALIGVDLEQLVERALIATCACGGCDCSGDIENLGVALGAALGELALQGRDKVTFIASVPIASFGDWVEQLIAESTGKEGKGILPVVGESVGDPSVYGIDRVFVDLRLQDDPSLQDELRALEEAGHPVIRLPWIDRYSLGGQFLLWEMATAVAGSILGINPFDQPNVEAAKILARDMVARFDKEGRLPPLDATLSESGLTVIADEELPPDVDSPHAAIESFLQNADAGAYIAIQAFVEPAKETEAALDALRMELRDRYRLATTLGYGPRFLHSTGQLHKGDAGHGYFIQVVSDNDNDADIPDVAGKSDSAISFGVLKRAQSLGDRQALLDGGRRVLRLEVQGTIEAAIGHLSHTTLATE